MYIKYAEKHRKHEFCCRKLTLFTAELLFTAEFSKFCRRKPWGVIYGVHWTLSKCTCTSQSTHYKSILKIFTINTNFMKIKYQLHPRTLFNHIVLNCKKISNWYYSCIHVCELDQLRRFKNVDPKLRHLYWKRNLLKLFF